MRRALHLAAVALLAAAAAGCGGGAAGTAPTATVPDGTGYFVGTGPEGLGAAVDLLASDAVTDAVREETGAEPVQGPPPLAIGMVAVVNARDEPVPLPRFVAVLDGGGAVPLTPARTSRNRLGAAVRHVPAPPLFVPADGSATTYVVLAGAAPAEVDHVRMVVRAGEAVRLGTRRR